MSSDGQSNFSLETKRNETRHHSHADDGADYRARAKIEPQSQMQDPEVQQHQHQQQQQRKCAPVNKSNTRRARAVWLGGSVRKGLNLQGFLLLPSAPCVGLTEYSAAAV